MRELLNVLDETCQPMRGTRFSAMVDLRARETVVIGAGETKIVPLGVTINLDALRDNLSEKMERQISDSEFEEYLETHYIELCLRSNHASKGLIIANGKGVIDLDFEKEIGVILHNPLNMTNVDYSSRYHNILLAKRIIVDSTDEELVEAIEELKNGYKKDFIYTIEKGERVAQFTIAAHETDLTGYISDVVRKDGFGSTGK